MASGQLGNLMRFVRRLVHAPAGAEHSDRQLLERFAEQRDEAAFSELVARHGPMVFNVCRRVLDDAHAAEDAFQAAFLVLARKAAALHWHESVGNWLYETAFRTASKAKGDNARRRAREQQSAAVPRSDPMPELDWRELRGVLDQELSRLPAKYRSPLVLCYLEGKSNEEAARLLGWPVGTVSGRLARARDLLRDRLTRRGLALTVSSLSVALSQHALEAAVPPTLAEAAVQSAVLFTSGAAASGAIAVPVTRLTEGVLQAMFLHQLKIVVGLVLLLGAAGAGMGLLAFRMLGQEAAAVPIGEVKPQAPAGGKEVNGLILSLSADSAETVMEKDGGNAVPVKLKLTFTNVSDKPIKLDAYDLFMGHMELSASGPDAESMRLATAIKERQLPSPVAEDFPVLKPGQEYVCTDRLEFPGSTGQRGSRSVRYALLKPGVYRLRWTYHNPQPNDEELAKGSWTGTLSSSEVVLKVKPAGPADRGEKPAYRVLKLHSARTKAPHVVMLNDQKSYQSYFEETFGKNFETEKVDFQSRQVVAIYGGRKPSSGYGISVVSVTGTAAETVLTVKTSSPKNGAAGADVLTHPDLVVEIPRCDKLKIVVTGDHTPAAMWGFAGSTTKELEVIVK